MSYPKSLIIGLGGIGSEIVCNVYKRFIDSDPADIDKEKAGFLCFDTDLGDIEARRKIMPKECVVQTSSTENITVATYLDRIKDQSTVKEWFDHSHKTFNEMTLGSGAGQIRMASRLALSLAIEENKLDIIKNVLNRILRVQADKEEGNDVKVHIISSIAGGTGSGSFLQMSYLVKEILRNEKGLDKPSITGYFLLADILCQDNSTQFDEPKANNVLANTYASLKELNGIYNYEKTSSFNIDFEYRLFTKEEQNLSLPDFEPFEVSYLYDYEDSKGENRGKKENYYEQVEDYLYLNVLSPIGSKTRSAAINDILSRIKARGLDRYAATGVSKIIYPVDDLFRFFSVKRVAENLKTSWLKIDKAYQVLLAEYKRKINQGVIISKPELDKFFMDQVEFLSKNGAGLEKMIFRKIYQSTQEFDTNGTLMGPRSLTFVKELLAYLTKAKEQKKSINDRTTQINLPADFVESRDQEQDRRLIMDNEIIIRNLQKDILEFIDNTKSLGIEEGLLADHNEFNYSSLSNSRINTYIFKDEAMHPLAVRYFMYDLRRQLRIKLSSLKEGNEKIWDIINGYSEFFDIKDDQEKDEHIETADEAYGIYARKDKKLIKKLGKVFGKSGSLDEFKENYITRTKRQINLLNEFAITKLQEEVISGLLMQIDIMIAEIERLFNNLTDVHSSLTGAAEKLLYLHDYQSNKSTQYVLATAKFKQKLYDEKIAANDDFEFPSDLSRLIYNSLYQNVFQLVNKRSEGKDLKMPVIKLFNEDVIDKQLKTLLLNHSEGIAGYNVIKAICYEAELNGNDELEYLKNYFRNAVSLARPLGAKNLAKASFINSWGFHPDCISEGTKGAIFADEIMGASGDKTNGAHRVESSFFRKNEIIREDSRFLLVVPNNYPQFSSGDKNSEFAPVSFGKYYKAYKSRIEDVLEGNSVSPHLDKRWHYPGYFPNLGETREVVAEKIYRAFFWGLVNQDLICREDSGEKLWAYNRISSNTTKTIQDQHQKNIRFTIPDLIFKGLYSNPGIVDSVLERVYEIIDDNKSEFEGNYNKDRINALLNVSIIKDISRFRLQEIRQLKDLTILKLLEKVALKDKEDVITKVILENIYDCCIYIGGDNLISKNAFKKLCNNLLGADGNEKHTKGSIIENIVKSRTRILQPFN